MSLGSADVLASQATSGRPTGSPPLAPRNAPSAYGPGYGSGTGGYGSPQYDWGGYAAGMRNRWMNNPHYGDYSQPSDYQRYLDLYTRQMAPDLANFQTQGALLGNRMDLALAQQALSGGQLRQQFGFDMQGLGLDRQGLGIQSNAARRGLRMTRREEAIMRDQLANSQAQANAQAEGQTWNARSDATAAGAMTAPGIRHDLGQIYGNLVLTREANQLGFDRDLLGLRERRGSLRDQLRNTRLEAQRLGLREDELRAGLRSGLRQLRLDTSMSINDILGGLSSNNASQAALMRQILEMALRAAQGV